MALKGMTREQKWSVIILSFGTFLEYFDLMLYVHMAVLLNEYFFPKTSSTATQLLTAFTFCSTYLLRPVGGFIIGKIGDAYGRKITVLITTFVMATSCIVMANIGTYAEIGITASIVMISCRMLQGFSSLGEIVGAEIYIVEILRQPYRYVCNSIIFVASRSGGLLALAVASFVLTSSPSNSNWRLAFWIGAIIAVVGIIARTRLRETPEFADYKRRIARKMELSNQNKEACLKVNDEKIDKKAVIAYFFAKAIEATCIYVTYIYTGDFMKMSLKMSAVQVINQNLKVTATIVILTSIMVYIVKRNHPLKIMQINMFVSVIFWLFIPYWFHNISSLTSLFLLQIALFSLGFSSLGIEVVYFKYFPIAKRFTILGTTFGISVTLAYIVTSFGLIPLTQFFSYYGLWFIFIPLIAGSLYAMRYLKKLEIERGLYYDYPCEEKGKPDTILEDHRYDDESYLGDEYEPFKGSCEHSIELVSHLEELNKTMDRKVNINAVKHGITFAKKWHHGQPRNTGEPFYSHPMAVAKLASTYYFKTDIIIAALLHDTIEDCKGCTLDLIEEKFNKRIAEMVEGLTKNKIVNGKDKILSFEETLEMLHKAEEYETLFVKEMDRIHNLQTADGWKPKKRRQKVKETMEHMLPRVAYVAEKLGIHGRIHLENKVFDLCQKITAKDAKK